MSSVRHGGGRVSQFFILPSAFCIPGPCTEITFKRRPTNHDRTCWSPPKKTSGRQTPAWRIRLPKSRWWSLISSSRASCRPSSPPQLSFSQPLVLTTFHAVRDLTVALLA